jgi:hypothetical protein
MATPLKKTWSPLRPYMVERSDEEDGSICYEIWDYRPESYHRLCTVHEDPIEDDEPCEDRGRAKRDADMIVAALNATVEVE